MQHALSTLDREPEKGDLFCQLVENFLIWYGDLYIGAGEVGDRLNIDITRAFRAGLADLVAYRSACRNMTAVAAPVGDNVFGLVSGLDGSDPISGGSSEGVVLQSLRYLHFDVVGERLAGRRLSGIEHVGSLPAGPGRHMQMATVEGALSARMMGVGLPDYPRYIAPMQRVWHSYLVRVAAR